MPALLGAVVLAAAGTTQERRDPPAARFERILWLHGEHARDATFHAAVRAAGYTAVSVSIGEDPAVPGAHGLRFYLDQAAGKGVLELREAQWRSVYDAFEATRDPDVLHRPADLADPESRALVRQRIDAALGRAGPHGPVAISIGDEISATYHANPLDLCAAPTWRARFAEWLEARYGDPHTLARAWRVAPRPFASVTPWTADRIRDRELGGATLPDNLTPWSDQLEFTDALFAEVVVDAVERARELCPGVPVGLTGIQPPSAYGGHDYARLLPHLGFVEAYDIGGARDLADCLAPPDSVRMATLFPPKDGGGRALTLARLADLVAHGMDGVIVWSSGDVFDDRLEDTPFGAAVRAAFARLGSVAEQLAGARIERAPVLLVESQASVRAHWMLDSAGDGRTWIRRWSSYEAAHSTALATRAAWLRLFEDLGVQAGCVAARDLERRLADDPPRILVLPACLALSDPAVAAIRTWVAAGGLLIADWGTALYDERLKLRPEGALDGLFGVRRPGLRWRDFQVRGGVARGQRHASGLGIAERGLDAELGEAVEGVGRIHIESTHGRGRAVYLGLAVCEYAAARLDPARTAMARELRARVRRLLQDAGVRPPVLVRAPGCPTCIERVPLRARDGSRYLAIRINALDAPHVLEQLEAPLAATVTFPARVRVRDLASGAELGIDERFELPLDPWTGIFLEWSLP